MLRTIVDSKHGSLSPLSTAALKPARRCEMCILAQIALAELNGAWVITLALV